MAIKFGSALDSIERRGIAHDGKINGGGLAASIAAAVPGVTLADKMPVTERNAKSKNVTKPHETVTQTVTKPMSNADRQRSYRQRKSEESKNEHVGRK